ncbi:MAG: LysR family transcriptional regulator [Pseudomonadota bacterium]
MDIKPADLGLLVALDALLHHQGVTPAANQLGISQPAMSAQLARLRKLFNDPLLTSSGRKLIPTPRALNIQAPLKAVLADLELIVRQQAHFDPQTTTATFRLIGTDYVHGVLASGISDALKSQAPNARLSLLAFRPETTWDQLETDEADLVLATGLNLPDARMRPGMNETFQVIQRKHHPRGTHPMTLDEFCAADHALVSPEGGGFFGATDKVLKKLGLARHVVCSLPSFLLAPPVIAGSDLLALVPKRLARASESTVDAFDPPFSSPRFAVDLLWHPRRQKDPSHSWFRDLVANQVAKT